MYYSQETINQACSANSVKGSLHRAIMEIGDIIDSTEINEAEECLKCGGDRDCPHMEAQKVNMKSLEEIENDLYWEGVLAEKNENRSL